MSVYLLATLDTKGLEAAYLRDVLRSCGVDVKLVDAGCQGAAGVEADVPREVLFAAGDYDVAELASAGDRGLAVNAAAACAAKFISQRHARGAVDGVLALGGSAGTTIGASAMRALPLGVPKVMVSTLASGQVRQFVGDKDIAMFNSVCDIAGLNRISRTVLTNAALAMAGMVRLRPPADDTASRPLVAATMFGVTTPCVEHARRVLEEAGYEVLVFHATGSGGQAMESLISEGHFAGVLDLTTTELADELVGGFLTAGPTRLTAAARHGVPQVVSVGATDMVNFYAPESVPPRFADRLFHHHNANVTLMRTTPEENAAIGAEIGRKLAASRAATAVVLPLQGVSALDRESQPFCDPAARAALFDALRAAAGELEILPLDCHINDIEFATAAARKLLQMLANASGMVAGALVYLCLQTLR